MAHPGGREPLAGQEAGAFFPGPRGLVVLPPGTRACGPGRLCAPLAGRAPGRYQGVQGLIQGAGRRQPAVQPGQPEQLADLRPGADQVQAAAVRGGPLGRADQRGQPGRIDEADLVQVGDPAAGRRRPARTAAPAAGSRWRCQSPRRRSRPGSPVRAGPRWSAPHPWPASRPARPVSCPGRERPVLPWRSPGIAGNPLPAIGAARTSSCSPLPWPG